MSNTFIKSMQKSYNIPSIFIEGCSRWRLKWGPTYACLCMKDTWRCGVLDCMHDTCHLYNKPYFKISFFPPTSCSPHHSDEII